MVVNYYLEGLLTRMEEHDVSRRWCLSLDMPMFVVNNIVNLSKHLDMFTIVSHDGPSHRFYALLGCPNYGNLLVVMSLENFCCYAFLLGHLPPLEFTWIL